ncbi:MAG: GNAT family N-acetyltransferase [Bacteroidales bacterium]|nr:GNAT family N-acetyltransferase [Bacteroidales bacterium]
MIADPRYIRKAEVGDSKSVAGLHKEAINKGFLSTLPLRFLQLLYRYLITNEIVFVYANKNEIYGYISCALQPDGLLKRFVTTHFLSATLQLFPVLFRLRTIKKILETGRATHNKSAMHVPEILSVAVSKEYRLLKIGQLLLIELENSLTHKQFTHVKVVAGKSLEAANRFYQNNGFIKVDEMIIHDDELSYVYLKKINGHAGI